MEHDTNKWYGALLRSPGIDPARQPDEYRRYKFLNIILVGVFCSAAVSLLAAALFDALSSYPQDEMEILYLVSATALAAMAIVFVINNFWSTKIARLVFSAFLLLLFSLSDTPQNVAAGRAVISFAVIIVIYSVLFRPFASFVAAALSGVVVSGISLSIGLTPDPFVIITFFVVALISWLSARSLEHALRDLNVLNAGLERKVDERTRALADSLANVRAIVNSTIDGIIVFGTDSRITLANPAASAMLLPSGGSVIGREIGSLIGNEVPPDDKERVVRFMAERSASNSGLKFRWGASTYSAGIAPVRDDDGVAIGAVAVMHDITREAEIDRMKSTFISIASHELRTPLAAILAHTEMLKGRLKDGMTPPQIKTIERLSVNVGQMMSLVNSLLDKAMLDAGRLKLDYCPVSFAKLLDDIVAVTETTALAKHLSFERAISGSLPPDVLGDADRIRQIGINLVSNAVKYTPSGSVGLYFDTAVGGRWALRVTDTGPGIDPEYQRLVFRPFYQVENERGGKAGGAGLGLSIVKELSELMGGEVRLESEMGKGSTFSVLLPLARPTGRAAASALLIARVDVELERYRYALAAAGCTTVEVDSGASALQWLADNVPELIVADTDLGETSIIKVVEFVKKSPRLRRTKIILLTGREFGAGQAAFGHEGALPKPVNYNQLRLMASRLLTSATDDTGRNREQEGPCC